MLGRIWKILVTGFFAVSILWIITSVGVPFTNNCAMPVAHALGTNYLRQNNPVCRQSFELYMVRLIDAGEGVQDDQESDPDTHKYPGRCVWTEDQYQACWRDGGTPHYERLAFANATNPVGVPEWIPTTTGTTIVPLRGDSWGAGIGRTLVNDALYWLQVGDSTIDRGHARIEGNSANATKSHLSILGGLAGAAEVQLISESAAGVGFSELHTITNTPLHLGTNDTRWMTIKATTGWVGIGTEDPGAITHIVGINDLDGVPDQLSISDSGDETIALRIGYEDTWDAGSIAASDSGTGWKPLVLQPVAGNVGVNTTAPQSVFHVAKSDAAITIDQTVFSWAAGTTIAAQFGAWSVIDAAGTYFYRYTGAGTLHDVAYVGQESNTVNWGLSFKTDAAATRTVATTTRMHITAAGDVGINTLLPDQLLQVNGTLQVGDDTTTGSVVNVVGAGASDFGIQFGTEADPDNAGSIVHNTGGGGMFFEIAGTEEMRLTSTGLSVGLAGNPDSTLHVWNATAGAIAAVAGTLITAENSSDAFITILSPTANTGGIYFGSTAGNTRGGVTYTQSTHGAPDILSFTTSSASQWQIDASGDLLATTDNADDIGASGATRPQNVYIANDVKQVRLIHAQQGTVPTCTIAGGWNNGGGGAPSCSIGGTSRSMRGTITVVSDDNGATATVNTCTVTYVDSFDTSAIPIVQGFETGSHPTIQNTTINITSILTTSFTFTVNFPAGAPAHAGANYLFVYQTMG